MTALDDYLAEPGKPGNREFARLIGCSRAHVSRLRAGSRTPSMSLAYRIELATSHAVPVHTWAVIGEAA